MHSKCTKADLIESLYSSLAPTSKITRKGVHLLIDRVFEELSTAILDGKAVELRGFGTFEARLRKGKSKARNPKTGEIVSVKDHGVAYFKPGKELKAEAFDKAGPKKSPKKK